MGGFESFNVHATNDYKLVTRVRTCSTGRVWPETTFIGGKDAIGKEKNGANFSFIAPSSEEL